MKALRFCLFSVVFALSCSQQSRTADTQVTSKDVQQMLDDAIDSNNSDTSAPALALAAQLKQDPNTTLFFSYALPKRHSPMGPVSSVFAMGRLDFMDASLGRDYTSISQVRLFFLDNPGKDSRSDVLIVGVVPTAQPQANLPAVANAATATTTKATSPPPSSATPPPAVNPNISTAQFSYYAYQGQGSIAGGTFSAVLKGDNGQTITVASTNVKKGNLDGVIQLNVYSGNTIDNENFIGRFSILQGYQ